MALARSDTYKMIERIQYNWPGLPALRLHSPANYSTSFSSNLPFTFASCTFFTSTRGVACQCFGNVDTVQRQYRQHGVFVCDWLFVFPLCGFSLSLFCN